MRKIKCFFYFILLHCTKKKQKTKKNFIAISHNFKQKQIVFFLCLIWIFFFLALTNLTRGLRKEYVLKLTASFKQCLSSVESFQFDIVAYNLCFFILFYFFFFIFKHLAADILTMILLKL